MRSESLGLRALIRFWVGRCAQALASRAWLVLCTLMVLLGLTVGLVTVSLRLQRGVGPPTAIDGSRGSIAGVAEARCAQLELYFAPTTTESEIRQALISQDALIVFGPNENAAFEVRVEQGRAAASRVAFEGMSAVERALPRAGCP